MVQNTVPPQEQQAQAHGLDAIHDLLMMPINDEVSTIYTVTEPEGSYLLPKALETTKCF